MSKPLHPNTYDMVMRFRVTLPEGETPEHITGEEYNPWPGVQIHDAELIKSQLVDNPETSEAIRFDDLIPPSFCDRGTWLNQNLPR